MKRARRHNRILAGSIATSMMLGIVYGIFRYAQMVIAAAPITVLHEAVFSEAYIAQLDDTLIDAVHKKGPTVVVADPQTYSPMISELSVRYRFPFHGLLSYQTVEPYAVLNHSAVANSNGTLVPCNMINPELCAELSAVQVPESLLSESEIPKLLTQFLKDSSPTLTQRFDCTWSDTDTCCYRDSMQPQYTLVASGKTPITDKDVQVYDLAVGQLKPERATKKWTVDLRFNGQVVIAPDGGS